MASILCNGNQVVTRQSDLLHFASVSFCPYAFISCRRESCGFFYKLVIISFKFTHFQQSNRGINFSSVSLQKTWVSIVEFEHLSLVLLRYACGWWKCKGKTPEEVHFLTLLWNIASFSSVTFTSLCIHRSTTSLT